MERVIAGGGEQRNVDEVLHEADLGAEDDLVVRQPKTLGGFGGATALSTWRRMVTSMASSGSGSLRVFIHHPGKEIPSSEPQLTPMRTAYHSTANSMICGSARRAVCRLRCRD